MAGSPKKRARRAAIEGCRARNSERGHAPSTLTPELRERLLAHIEAGAYLAQAAALELVPLKTLEGWMHKGRQQPEREPFGSFAREVTEARVKHTRMLYDAAIRAATVPDGHGHVDGKLALDLLKRRDPKHYGDAATKVELTGGKGAPLGVQIFLPEVLPLVTAPVEELLAEGPADNEGGER